MARRKSVALTDGELRLMRVLWDRGRATVGETVDEAAFWFISMERSCQAQLMAMAAGDPIEIRDEYATYTQQNTGFHAAGWFSFQPLWDEIARTDPELFE